MRFEEITDCQRLEDYLTPQPVRAAYQLGDLDPVFFKFTRWFAMTAAGEIRALLMLYNGLSVPAVMTLGEVDAVGELVEHASRYLPRRFYAHVLTEHESAFAQSYRQEDWRQMVRMGLLRERYQPASGVDGVVQVTHRDTAALINLYRAYPDNFFEPYQLETGLYFGCWQDGILVAAAGVHVVSERYSVAAVGNVVTHPDYRRSGYSTRCTDQLLAALFERVERVALNVRRDNVAALGCFTKLGFEESNDYTEGFAELG